MTACSRMMQSWLGTIDFWELGFDLPRRVFADCTVGHLLMSISLGKLEVCKCP